MASVEVRGTAPDLSYRVRWRNSGERIEATWSNPEDAKNCKSIVEGLRGRVTRAEAIRLTLGEPEPEPAPVPRGMTLDEWYERWFELKSGVQDDTLEGYETHYERRIRNAEIDGRRLGGMELTAISRETIAAWVKALPTLHRPIGSATIRRHHATLHQILEAAVQHDKLASNPARRTKLPKAEVDADDGDEQVFLDEAEADKLVAVLTEGLPRDLTMTFLGTGIRFGEISALRVCDVITRPATPQEVEDLGLANDARVAVALNIRRAWKHSKKRGWYIGAPKSKRSKRKVSLPTKTSMVVSQRMRGLPDHALIFSVDGHTRLDNKAMTQDHLVPAIIASGIAKEPRWHDLRHTHVAWLIADKASLPAIQRRLGHESIVTTIDTYGHLLPDLDDELLAALDARLPV